MGCNYMEEKGKNKIIRVVGIDFGTSTSLIKVKRYKSGEPIGDRFFTNGVTFGNGEADTKAVTIVRRNADGTLTCGRDADEPMEGAEIFKDFKMKLECENPVEKEQAEQLTERFLSYLYTWYVQQSSTFGSAEDVEQTIISYPVKWKDETRVFMEQAAIKAGFQNVTSRNEALAALYTVLSQQSGELGKKGMIKSGQTGYLLLIDMGAGTTDLAFSRFHVAENPMGILHAEDISNEIIATWPVKGSRLACGGREIDKVLEKYVADYLKGMKSNGQSLSPEQAEQIASANSAAKKWKEETVSRDLNEGKTVTTCGYVAAFSMIFGGASFPGFDRFKFEQMISGHILDFRQLLEGGLQAAQREDKGLSENHLDFVILTGGHSNWYFAKDMLDGSRGGLNHPLLSRVQSEKQRIICLPNPQETVSLGLVYSLLPFKMETKKKTETETGIGNKIELETELNNLHIPVPSPLRPTPLVFPRKYYKNWSQNVLLVGGEDIAIVRPDGTVYCSAQDVFFSNLKEIDKLIAVSYLEVFHLEVFQIFVAIDKRGYPSFHTNLNKNRIQETVIAAKKVTGRFVDFLRHGFPQLMYLIGLTYDGRIVELDGSETGRNLTPFNDIVYMTGTGECICFFRADGSLWKFNGSVAEDQHLYGNVKEHEWSWYGLEQFVMSPDDEALYAGLKKDGTVMTSAMLAEAGNWKKIISISIGDSHLVGLTKKGEMVVCDCDNRPFIYYPIYNFGVAALCYGRGKFLDVIADGRRTAAVRLNGRVIHTTWGAQVNWRGKIKDYGYLDTPEVTSVKLC